MRPKALAIVFPSNADDEYNLSTWERVCECLSSHPEVVEIRLQILHEEYDWLQRPYWFDRNFTLRWKAYKAKKEAYRLLSRNPKIVECTTKIEAVFSEAIEIFFENSKSMRDEKELASMQERLEKLLQDRVRRILNKYRGKNVEFFRLVAQQLSPACYQQCQKEIKSIVERQKDSPWQRFCRWLNSHIKRQKFDNQREDCLTALQKKDKQTRNELVPCGFIPGDSTAPYASFFKSVFYHKKDWFLRWIEDPMNVRVESFVLNSSIGAQLTRFVLLGTKMQSEITFAPVGESKQKKLKSVQLLQSETLRIYAELFKEKSKQLDFDHLPSETDCMALLYHMGQIHYDMAQTYLQLVQSHTQNSTGKQKNNYYRTQIIHHLQAALYLLGHVKKECAEEINQIYMECRALRVRILAIFYGDEKQGMYGIENEKYQTLSFRFEKEKERPNFVLYAEDMPYKLELYWHLKKETGVKISSRELGSIFAAYKGLQAAGFKSSDLLGKSGMLNELYRTPIPPEDVIALWKIASYFLPTKHPQQEILARYIYLVYQELDLKGFGGWNIKNAFKSKWPHTMEKLGLQASGKQNMQYALDRVLKCKQDKQEEAGPLFYSLGLVGFGNWNINHGLEQVVDKKQYEHYRRLIRKLILEGIKEEEIREKKQKIKKKDKVTEDLKKKNEALKEKQEPDKKGTWLSYGIGFFDGTPPKNQLGSLDIKEKPLFGFG